MSTYSTFETCNVNIRNNNTYDVNTCFNEMIIIYYIF